MFKVAMVNSQGGLGGGSGRRVSVRARLVAPRVGAAARARGMVVA